MKRTKLKFHLSFEEFHVLVNSKTSFALRDVEALAVFGYNEERINQIRVMNENLMAAISNAEMDVIRREQTQRKSEMIEQIREQLRKMDLFIELAYGRNTKEQKYFHLEGIGKLTEKGLLSRMNVIRKIYELKKDSLPTSEMLSSAFAVLDEFVLAYSDLLDQIALTDAQRILETDNRVQLANELYNELMTMCQVGKTVWFSSNPSKHNNYLVYATGSRKPKEEEIAAPETNANTA